MKRFLKLFRKEECGLTLIELSLAIAITAILVTGFTMTFYQVASANARSASHMATVKQVESALYWINHDTQMSLSISTGSDPADTGFPLTLSWSGYGTSGNQYMVIYTLVDNELIRAYSVNGGDPTYRTIAKYISMDPEHTNCQYEEGALYLEFTASVDGPYPATETRIYQITKRTDSS
ncbi:type II secretion system protein J [Chloroflexota bacterium]